MKKAHIPIWSRVRDGVSFSDVPTRGKGRIPDFCIIGSAKCGTSSLNSYLSDHPSIFMCDLKEPNYFSTPVMLERGEHWYRGLFEGAEEGRICGEASTSYTRYPAVVGTAQRIFEANPQMKLVYSIREPVRRVESDCLQVMKYVKGVLGIDFTDMNLDDFFERLSDPKDEFYCAPLETSMYAMQLEQFEQFFPRSQFLIIEQENLFADTKRILEDVLSFLDLEFVDSINLNIKKNKTSDFEEGLMEERYLDSFRKYGYLYHLVKRSLPLPLKNYIKKRGVMGINIDNLKFSEELKEKLRAEFSISNNQLRERYNLELCGWS